MGAALTTFVQAGAARQHLAALEDVDLPRAHVQDVAGPELQGQAPIIEAWPDVGTHFKSRLDPTAPTDWAD